MSSSTVDVRGAFATHVTVTDDALTVELSDGRTISVPLAWYPRLLHATPSQRSNWRRAGGGYGIHWPDIDEDLSTEGLLRGAPAPRPPSSKTPARKSRSTAKRSKGKAT